MNFATPLIADHSVRSLLAKRADETPDAPYLIDETGQTLTYREADAGARSVAALIAAQGVQPGQSVAYAMSNGIDAALVILGALYGGYLTVAVNLVAGQETVSYVLDHSKSRLVLHDEGAKELVTSALSGQETPPELLQIGPDAFIHSPISYPDIAASADGLLMYTSGTTGRPKGVVLTHGNLLAGGANAVLAHVLTPDDRALCVLPLYHINGLCVSLLGSLVSGSSVVIPPKFRVSTFWETVVETRCTWLSLVPTQISYLLHEVKLSEPPAGVRFARSASAPLSPDVQTAFEAAFGVPIVETMGLTETAAQILSNPLPPGTRKIGSPGIAFGNEVVIADPLGQEMPPGEEGELLVRGPNVMREYLYNEKATRDSLTSDGWLRSGDLGRMDADGYVFITGRLKELIIKGGENIAPREIDDALYSHPDVIEAAAFALPCPHYGEKVEAGVVLTEGTDMDGASLVAHCIAKIGSFKAPDHVHVFDALPKGPSGKIQRIKLAAQVSRD
ncbi:AMP-binding protein [Roseobacter sp.]|uniref:AMP-binding protein n=1 Tax=Roseobacter sp. TaxID=1907202 RepID=UPI00329A7AF5